MTKEELIKNVCSALYAYVVYLEWPEGYQDNIGYRDGLEEAKKVRKYIEELKKL